MYDNLLAVADKSRSVPISEAALYALLGFIVVFLGISFLIFMVWLVGKVISKSKGSEVKPVKESPTVNPEKPSISAISLRKPCGTRQSPYPGRAFCCNGSV